MLFRFLLFLSFVVVAFLPQLPHWPQLFSFLWGAGLFFLLLCFSADADSRCRLLKFSLLVVVACWAVIWGKLQLEQRLASELEGLDLRVEGTILTAKRDMLGRERFDIDVERAFRADGSAIGDFPSRVRVSRTTTKDFRSASIFRGTEVSGDLQTAAGQQDWGAEKSDIEPGMAGQGWSFWVRLKRPHGFANAQSFDYERWLLAHGIGASGYIKTAEQYPAHRIEFLDNGFQLWRAGVAQKLQQHFSSRPEVVATLVALALGQRTGLNEESQQLIQRLGLSHLLAISGLHVGLAAMFGALMGRCIGALVSAFRPLSNVGLWMGLLFGVVVALGYAWVAGLSLATQRAVIMLLVAAAWFLCYRRYSPWLAWWWSMLVVLVCQPLSVLEPGFWFSFVAVAVLMLLLRERASGWRRWWLVIKTQCLLCLCLTCLQWYLGDSVSVLSPLANLVAIPFVSLLVVPQILLALGMSLISWEGSLLLWQGAYTCLELFWWCLEQCEHRAVETLLPVPRQVTLLEMVLVVVALALLLLPWTYPSKALALLILVAIWWSPTQAARAPNIDVLDVGQGLAIVVSSDDQVLLYDTGPRFSPLFSAGEAVVKPFLTGMGVGQLKVGVISHWDNDHTGGVLVIDREFDVKQWLSSDLVTHARKVLGEGVADCLREQAFQLGAWQVYVLGHSLGDDASIDPVFKKRNNRSCVLLLEYQGFRVLLPGDIERRRELELLAHPRLQQPVDLLLAPHHGSGTSSSAAWVAQLSPRWVVFSAGYRNRYHHPQRQVWQRYLQQGSKAWVTAESGAINVTQDHLGRWKISGYRESHRRYWR
ncbi:MAG: DNA internalization-related competence protein ComEC/Rec2 [Cellvibrionaceae bacterium]|nr:DNA internalization-related competence protein ComEC/Rec2 [Cellvibrionaceae bacterium]